MCHRRHGVWNREPETEDESEDDELPDYLNEESAAAVELLTDGGDE